MKSFIPKQEKVSKERIGAKLEISLVRKLGSYCQYLESDRDYVISRVLEIAFKKDKGFAQWLALRKAELPSANETTQAAPQAVRERKLRGAAAVKGDPNTAGPIGAQDRAPSAL